MDALKKLQDWYYSCCNGVWEHQRGIEIGTIDNPGWRVEINLTGTKNENTGFERIKIERTENDWIHCWIKDGIFNIACGPLNLEEALGIFLKWAKDKNDKRYCQMLWSGILVQPILRSIPSILSFTPKLVPVCLI